MVSRIIRDFGRTTRSELFFNAVKARCKAIWSNVLTREIPNATAKICVSLRIFATPGSITFSSCSPPVQVHGRTICTGISPCEAQPWLGKNLGMRSNNDVRNRVSPITRHITQSRPPCIISLQKFPSILGRGGGGDMTMTFHVQCIHIMYTAFI